MPTDLLLAWSLKLSTLRSNTLLLSRMVEEGATPGKKTATSSSSKKSEQQQSATTMFATVDEHRSTVNLHLQYMLLRPDIYDAPIDFRTAVISAYIQGLLTDTSRITLAQRIPELLETLIPQSAEVLEEYTALSVFTATSYPELLLANIKLTRTSTLLTALRALVRSPRPPECLDDSDTAQNVLTELKGRNICTLIDMQNWVNIVAPLAVRAGYEPCDAFPILREAAVDPQKARWAMISDGAWRATTLNSIVIDGLVFSETCRGGSSSSVSRELQEFLDRGKEMLEKEKTAMKQPPGISTL
jgi:hypothetical protein